MLNKILSNRRGQVADAMNWIVATLVIVTVLGISIALVSSPLFNQDFFLGKNILNLDDKKKDFIATKSVVGFLSKNENIALLKTENKELIKDELSGFTEVLPTGSSDKSGEPVKTGGWNFNLNGEKIVDKSPIKTSRGQDNFFIRFDEEELKIVFWETCIGKCS